MGNKDGMCEQPNIALVPLDADLDVSSVHRTRKLIDAIIDGGCRRMVLNMAGVGHIDSAGMGLIFHEVRRMRTLGGLLSITNANARVLRALRIARLVDFAPVSGMGPRPSVPALDPTATPSWRRVIRINPHDLASTRARVGELLGHLPLSQDDLFDMTLVVGEAIGNAVDHTSGSCALVALASYADRIVIDVTDCGCGFELTEGKSAPPVSADGERGRGIKLMQLLADSVTIGRRPSGRGTCVHIVKLVGSPRPDSVRP